MGGQKRLSTPEGLGGGKHPVGRATADRWKAVFDRWETVGGVCGLTGRPPSHSRQGSRPHYSAYLRARRASRVLPGGRVEKTQYAAGGGIETGQNRLLKVARERLGPDLSYTSTCCFCWRSHASSLLNERVNHDGDGSSADSRVKQAFVFR